MYARADYIYYMYSTINDLIMVTSGQTTIMH